MQMWPSIDEDDWVSNPRMGLFFPRTPSHPAGDESHWVAFTHMLQTKGIDSEDVFSDITTAAHLVAKHQFKLTCDGSDNALYWRARLGGEGADPSRFDATGKHFGSKPRHAFYGHHDSETIVRNIHQQAIQRRKGQGDATRQTMDLPGRVTQPHYEEGALDRKYANLRRGFYNGRLVNQGNRLDVHLCERTR